MMGSQEWVRATFLAAPDAKSPEGKAAAVPKVSSGEIRDRGSPPPPSEPYGPLEAALERLRSAVLNRSNR
jgi:hypothetical protein